jgi:chromosome segregation ATPase
MHIERVQIDEGFLDGIDLSLTPGLNVVIGARGTGKTSLIELIRFCLGISGYTVDSAKRSFDHAISVLGGGQVTITLNDGGHKITVSRSAQEPESRSSAPFVPPIIFSQLEIEAVGLQASGRLRLLDGFTGDRRQVGAEEAAATAEIRSLTAEMGTVRKEIEDLEKQIAELPLIDKQLADLAPSEQGLTRASKEVATKKSHLDEIVRAGSQIAVSISFIERFRQSLGRWQSAIGAASHSAPQIEPWPKEAGPDLLGEARSKIAQSKAHLDAAARELAESASIAAQVAEAVATRRFALEEQTRQLRKEIEGLQAGAGNIVRQGQQLRDPRRNSNHSVLS